MTVFKGYMRIMKKNTGLILLYLGIFFGVTMALQAAAGKETYTSYESEKIKIGVVDKDNGPLAEGLVKWLEGTHHVTMLEDNREKLQEELFYRNAEYIVQIPKDFYKTCIVQDNPISVTKIPGSYTSFYVDQQINAWLNNVRTYIASGFSQKEAAKAALEQPSSRVSMYQDTETTSETPAYTYYFRYVPYLFLAVLCYSMGYILLAFQKEDIQKRMQASSVSIRRQNLEGLLAMFTIGVGLWLIAVTGAIVMYQKDLLASGVLTYYLLNTFVMMMVSLSLSYLLGLFVKNSNMLNGLSNIVSLGMCFLSGVFVPMSVMDKKVLKIAQFLPVYWYEDINETLARYHSVSGNIATDIWKSLGIEVMFALAFVAIILALSKYKRQK